MAELTDMLAERAPPAGLEFPGMPGGLGADVASAGDSWNHQPPADLDFPVPPRPADAALTSFPALPENPLAAGAEFPGLPSGQFSDTRFPMPPQPTMRETEFPTMPPWSVDAGNFPEMPHHPLADRTQFPAPPQALHPEASEHAMKAAGDAGMQDLLGMIRQVATSMGDAVTALRGLGERGGSGRGNARPASFEGGMFREMRAFGGDYPQEGYATASPSMSRTTSRGGLRGAGGYGYGTTQGPNQIDLLEPDKRRLIQG